MSTLGNMIDKVRQRIEDSFSDYRAEMLADHADEISLRQVQDALVGAFPWEQTPDGYEYWMRVFSRLTDIEEAINGDTEALKQRFKEADNETTL